MELNEKTVVFVDDEEFILRSLKRLFKREVYNTVFFEHAKDVIHYLDNNPVDLLVTDIRMPDMDGYQLLSVVKEKHPKVLRIALSGYTESKMIYNLIEKNIAKLFIFKPWDSTELKNTITNILEFEDILKSKNLLELINNLDSLPALPESYLKINELIERDSDINAIGKLISQDQAIVLKILKLANSAFYGRRTGDLNEAIMGIGLNNLKNIILGNAIFKGPKAIEKKLEEVWQHSVRTNRFVHMIYEHYLDKKVPSIFGSVGLLHDIGKVIFTIYFDQTYTDLTTKNYENEGSIVSEERETFKVTHQEIGAYLLNWWQLPFAYVESALYHHRPSFQGIINKELVYVVHLANYYSMYYFCKKGKEDFLDPKAFSYLSIDRDTLEMELKNAIKE
ncbi:MAG: HDOD domain-containing protein [Clostridia bacterium]|nr:HDOD domain-containing protein [Clostridia bacterium]